MQTDRLNESESESVNDETIIDDLKKSAMELYALINELSKLQGQMHQWSKSTIELFLLELRNTLSAFKQLIFCQILFICLFIFFLMSICIGAGVVTYFFTSNLLVSYGAFMVALSATLLGILLWQKHVLKFVGFSNTEEQIKEGVNVFTQQTKKRDSN